MAKSKIVWLHKSTSGVSLAMIPIELLTVNQNYQRELDKGRIDKTNKAFDPSAMRSLAVSEQKGGTFDILDGQHRKELAEKNGIKMVLCEVHHGLTPHREAELFCKFNNFKNVTPVQKFRANLFSNKKTERTIFNSVNRYGFKLKLNKETKGSEPAVIKSLGTLLQINKKMDKGTLDNTLQVISKCFRDTEGQISKTATMQQFIKGMAHYLNDTKLLPSDLIKHLQGQSADDIYKAAQAKTSSHRSDPWLQIYVHITQIVNSAKAENKNIGAAKEV